MFAFLHAPRFAAAVRFKSCNRFIPHKFSSPTRPPNPLHTVRAMTTHIPPPTVSHRLNTQPAPLYIDVRTPNEFADGHVPNAVNVPVTLGGGVIVPSFVQDVRDVIDPDQTLILGCKSGKRSSMAIDLLQKAGFEGLIEMDGGFDAWLANTQLPVER